MVTKTTMKWTSLLWLCVNLATSISLATNHDMPTENLQKPTSTDHSTKHGVGGANNKIKAGTIKQEPITVMSAEHLTQVTVDSKTAENDNGNEEQGITEEPVENHIDEISVETDGAESEDVSVGSVRDSIVNTTYGPVQGYRERAENIIRFLDIPYGKFYNTFEAPSIPELWTSPLENKKHTVKCPQLDGSTYKGDTNCLTLSVFTRTDINNASVLFYIHESDFNTGSGDPAIYPPNDLVNRGVIVILPNYRLGPLGFLCLRNMTAPGNAALKDLTLALEWTRRNIRYFGGNPSNIAVSGDGASAALAGYLALSSKSRNLISKVITDSGTALSHWAIDRKPLDSADKLADLIRIDDNNTSEDLFKELDVKKLVQSAEGLTFKPCIEQAENGSFISTTPWKILESETIEMSFIIGTANHAGLLQALKHDTDSISELNDHFTNILPNDLSFETSTQMNNIGLNLKAQYFGRDNITLERFEELSLYHTDASYLGPSLRVARALVEAGARVFLYEFSFVGALNKNLMNLVDPPEYGAVRGDIMGYLFPTTSPQAVLATKNEGYKNKESAEKHVMDLISDLWVSFLKTGEPSAEGVEWRPLNVTSDASEDYLSIGEATSPTNGLHPERLRLWTDIYLQHFVDRNAGSGISDHFVAAVTMFLIGTLNISIG